MLLPSNLKNTKCHPSGETISPHLLRSRPFAVTQASQPGPCRWGKLVSWNIRDREKKPGFQLSGSKNHPLSAAAGIRFLPVIFNNGFLDGEVIWKCNGIAFFIRELQIKHDDIPQFSAKWIFTVQYFYIVPDFIRNCIHVLHYCRDNIGIYWK